MNSINESSASSLRLFKKARNGDADSLALLLPKYFRYLNSLSSSRIDERIRMRVSSSDIVQETLLEAHRDFHNFVGQSLEEFTGWLRKILFNNLARSIESHILTAKRDVRKQRSLDEKVNDASRAADRFAASLHDRVPSASAAMHHDESLTQLMAAINQLPEDYRQVLQMRHFESLPFAEIAARMNRNPGAVRMLWVRAVEKLKTVMPNEDQ